MKKGTIYVVFGSNAVMLTRSYDQAIFCRNKYFLSPCIIRKYDVHAQAEDAAIDHLWSIAPVYKAIPNNLKMGKVYAVSKLNNNN